MSARWVVWSHAAVVVYTGAVLHLERLGILNFWTVDERGFNDYTVFGHVIMGSTAILLLTIYLFPILVAVALYRSQPPRRIISSVLAELLVVFAHLVAIYPFVVFF